MVSNGEGFELTASTQCISWSEFFDSKTQAVKKVWNWLRLGLVAPDLGMRLLYAFEEDAGNDMTILDHKLTLYQDIAACLLCLASCAVRKVATSLHILVCHVQSGR